MVRSQGGQRERFGDRGDKPLAFHLDDRCGMRRLDEVLVDDHGLDLTGWELLSAVAISDNGRTIVGLGYNPNGALEGWIARLHGKAHTPWWSDDFELR
jgi:hypothetical protein